MREFVRWLLSENNSQMSISLFNIWHIFYLLVIFGGTGLLSFKLGRKSLAAKEKAVRLFAYLTIGFYVADFFLMPLSDSYSGIATHKLPFHICTLMGCLAPFVQFNKRLAKFKTPVVTLAVASSVMWMCYPGSALGGQPPFSYLIFQTFMFHGVLFCWGILNLALGFVKLELKKLWQEFAGVLLILVWAWIGNTLYDGENNWFFIQRSIFPFLSDEVMPFMVVFCVTGVCFVIHLGYLGICKIVESRQKVLL